VSSFPSAYPTRPGYLSNLLDNSTVSIDSDACSIELRRKDVNGREWDATYNEFDINVNKYTQFYIFSPRHVYHQHINPFQIMEDIHDGFVARAGDWHDVIGGTYYMRVFTESYTGRVMMHCHLLHHEDEGMMAYYTIVDDTTSPCTMTDNASTFDFVFVFLASFLCIICTCV